MRVAGQVCVRILRPCPGRGGQVKANVCNGGSSLRAKKPAIGECFLRGEGLRFAKLQARRQQRPGLPLLMKFSPFAPGHVRGPRVAWLQLSAAAAY